MTEQKLFRVKATGTIVRTTSDDRLFQPVFGGMCEMFHGNDLEPVVAVPPNRVLPEGLEVVDVSGLVRRDGGPMPAAVLKLPKPQRSRTMLAIYANGDSHLLFPEFRFLADDDLWCDLIPKPREPKYRPFAGRDEAKHLFGQRVLRLGTEWLVFLVGDGFVSLCDGRATRYLRYDELLESATMLDGTPCGVREEG